jgi:hypothetical protein
VAVVVDVGGGELDELLQAAATRATPKSKAARAPEWRTVGVRPVTPALPRP